MSTIKEVRQVKVRGVKRWQARVQYQGRRASCLCESREAAKLAKADLLAKLTAEATAEQKAEAAPATIALACTGYLLDLEARGKGKDTISTARNATARLLEFLGARRNDPVEALTVADLYAYRVSRMQRWAKRGKKVKDGTTELVPGGAKATTVNRDLRTIRAMLKKVLPTFRFPAGVIGTEDETRVRWLDPKQEATVMIGIRAPFRQMAQLASLTLMRLSEIGCLRREYVHLEQGVITLPRTKTGPGVVILSAEAKQILEAQLRTHDSEWVFPNRTTGKPYSRNHISKVWRVRGRKAGLSDFHFHDLRHHGATVALNAGFSGPIVQELGRWKTERMMRRYAAVTNQTLRAAAEAISGNGQWQQTRNAFIGAH